MTENDAIGAIISFVLMVLTNNVTGFRAWFDGLGDKVKALVVFALYIGVGVGRCLVNASSNGGIGWDTVTACAGEVFELSRGGATAWVTLRKILDNGTSG